MILASILVYSCADHKNEPKFAPETTSNTKEMKKQLRHVVIFKFKESSTPEDIKEVENAFGKLPSEIKEIKAYEWGLNNSPEGLNKGFTHCFLVTFDSEEDRAIYLPHPAHKAFVEVLSPHLDDVMVIGRNKVIPTNPLMQVLNR
jgi:hypothetical protein